MYQGCKRQRVTGTDRGACLAMGLLLRRGRTGAGSHKPCADARALHRLPEHCKYTHANRVGYAPAGPISLHRDPGRPRRPPGHIAVPSRPECGMPHSAR